MGRMSAVLVVGLFLLSRSAFATVLDFELTPPLGDVDLIPQTYGDRASGSPNIEISYATGLSFWTDGYLGVSGVAFMNLVPGTGQIEFVADAGYRVVLHRFDVAWWPGNISPMQIEYYGADDELISAGPVASLPTGPVTIEPNLVQENFLRLRFGNSPDHAIDNVDFTQQPARVLVIVLDDVGVDLLDAYPAAEEYQAGTPHPFSGLTPSINSLTQQGVRFRNAWVSPLCLTSRIAMLTGRYTFESATESGTLDPSAEPLPKSLPPAVPSAAFGKWHVTNIADYRPTDAGFDLFQGIAGNPGASSTHGSVSKTCKGSRRPQPLSPRCTSRRPRSMTRSPGSSSRSSRIARGSPGSHRTRCTSRSSTPSKPHRRASTKSRAREEQRSKPSIPSSLGCSSALRSPPRAECPWICCMAPSTRIGMA